MKEKVFILTHSTTSSNRVYLFKDRENFKKWVAEYFLTEQVIKDDYRLYVAGRKLCNNDIIVDYKTWILNNVFKNSDDLACGHYNSFDKYNNRYVWGATEFMDD